MRTAAAPTVEQRQVQLVETESAAWDAYGAACRRAAPEDVRRSLYERATAAMTELARFEREQAHGAR